MAGNFEEKPRRFSVKSYEEDKFEESSDGNSESSASATQRSFQGGNASTNSESQASTRTSQSKQSSHQSKKGHDDGDEDSAEDEFESSSSEDEDDAEQKGQKTVPIPPQVVSRKASVISHCTDDPFEDDSSEEAEKIELSPPACPVQVRRASIREPEADVTSSNNGSTSSSSSSNSASSGGTRTSKHSKGSRGSSGTSTRRHFPATMNEAPVDPLSRGSLNKDVVADIPSKNETIPEVSSVFLANKTARKHSVTSTKSSSRSTSSQSRSATMSDKGVHQRPEKVDVVPADPKAPAKAGSSDASVLDHKPARRASTGPQPKVLNDAVAELTPPQAVDSHHPGPAAKANVQMPAVVPLHVHQPLRNLSPDSSRSAPEQQGQSPKVEQPTPAEVAVPCQPKDQCSAAGTPTNDAENWADHRPTAGAPSMASMRMEVLDHHFEVLEEEPFGGSQYAFDSVLTGVQGTGGSVYPERLQALIDTYNHLRGSLQTPLGMKAHPSQLQCSSSSGGHDYFSLAGQMRQEALDGDGVGVHSHRHMPSAVLTSCFDKRQREGEVMEKDLLAVVLTLMMRDCPRYSMPRSGPMIHSASSHLVAPAPAPHLSFPVVPQSTGPSRTSRPSVTPVRLLDASISTSYRNSHAVPCSPQPMQSQSYDRMMNSGNGRYQEASHDNCPQVPPLESAWEDAYNDPSLPRPPATEDPALLVPDMFPEAGSLRQAALEQLSKYVLQHYAGGTHRGQWGSAARCRILLVDLLHCLQLCLQRQGSALLQTAAHFAQFVGHPVLLGLTQAVMHCLPFEAVSSSLVTGAEVLPGGLYANAPPLDAKGYQLYRMEYWLTTSHIVELTLALSQAIHVLESMVILDYDVFQSVPQPSGTLQPSSDPNGLGITWSKAGYESYQQSHDDFIVDRDTHLFRLVVLPSSTALGAKWAKPCPNRQPEDCPTASMRAVSALRKEVCRQYLCQFGSHPPVDTVEMALGDTLQEVFADPVVRQTILEEVLKKLCPRPPHSQTFM